MHLSLWTVQTLTVAILSLAEDISLDSLLVPRTSSSKTVVVASRRFPEQLSRTFPVPAYPRWHVGLLIQRDV